MPVFFRNWNDFNSKPRKNVFPSLTYGSHGFLACKNQYRNFTCSLYKVAFQGKLKFSVKDNAHWLPVLRAFHTAIKHGIVCKNRIDSAHDGACCSSCNVNIPAGCIPCNPFAFACRQGSFSVCSHGILYDHIRCFSLYIVEENAVDGIAFFPKEILNYCNPSFFQLTDASAVYKCVWITASDDYGLDSAFDHRLSARRLFSRMAARFQSDIHFCP